MQLLLIGHNLPEELIAQFAVVHPETGHVVQTFATRAQLADTSFEAIRFALHGLEMDAEQLVEARYPASVAEDVEEK